MQQYFDNLRGASLALLLTLACGLTASAQTVFGLSENNLIRFNANLPFHILQRTPITGVNAAEKIMGLDFRPATGELYALAYQSATGMARLYTINTGTGAATAIGAAPAMLKAGIAKLSMDFNPTVDRVRVVGGDGSNYRMHPVTGVLAATDQNLAYATTDVNAGKTPSVGAVAYTNSFAGATTTTLYDYDELLNTLCTQIPPNNGTLNTIGLSWMVANPTLQNTDMDIYFDPATGANLAYLSINTHVNSPRFSKLCRINLATGQANVVNYIGYKMQVDDIAIQLAAPQGAQSRGEAQASVAFSTADFSLSPNPAADRVNLQFELAQPARVQVQVINLVGQTVAVQQQNADASGLINIALDVASYPKGAYFVRLLADGMPQGVKKLVVE